MKRLAQIILLLLLGVVVWQYQQSRRPPFDPAFLRLSPLEIMRLPLATRFDQPLGSEQGALTYNAQPFRLNRHLGDDLNGIGGQNSDLGDPVYASAFGRVVYANETGGGWGKMIILAHRVPDLTDPATILVIQTMYAHLDQMQIKHGQLVQRGQQIGTVGKADEQHLAHLHFEIREGPFINPSVGYADAPLNRISPERFLAERRGAADTQLGTAPALEQ